MFSKPFSAYNLKSVEYLKCTHCGFVVSKTHTEMSINDWEILNKDYHHSYQGKEFNPDDPRWIERLEAQAAVLYDAVEIGLIKFGKWLDYACGDGKLSYYLDNRYNITLHNYDRYMPPENNFLDVSQLKQRTFDFVITTSVFEHFTRRLQFDYVESLVNPENGVLGIHTVVCEHVPADPNWFYYLPVHCSFHTNKSMEMLFQQWGYFESVYNLEARLWLWFKKDKEMSNDIKSIVEKANQRIGGHHYIYKQGFVDYWK
jgi:hypothetical protein